MSQKLPVHGFKWVKKLSTFDKRFIKDQMKTVIRDIFNAVDAEYLKKYSIFIVIYHFYPKEITLKNVISLFVTYKTKETMLFT